MLNQERIISAALVSFLLIGQLFGSVPGQCDCGTESADAKTDSFCSEPVASPKEPSCCSAESCSTESFAGDSCTCGQKCGDRLVDCDCGCSSDTDQAPIPQQEADPTSRHSEVFVSATILFPNARICLTSIDAQRQIDALTPYVIQTTQRALLRLADLKPFQRCAILLFSQRR